MRLMEHIKRSLGSLGVVLVMMLAIPVMAGDMAEIRVPGVSIGADGSVTAPGVSISGDTIKVPGVTIDGDEVKVSGSHVQSTVVTDNQAQVSGDGQTINIDATDQQVVINGSRNDITCSGKILGVTLNGDDNRLTVTGSSQVLSLKGHHNKVAIHAVGRIEIAGDGNEVIWESSLDGPRPKVESAGRRNQILKKGEA